MTIICRGDSIKLGFNPDYNTVREIKDAAQILRDLIRKRRDVPIPDPEDFADIFDTMTQNFEVA